jgi:hypothetical protein
VSIAMFAPWKSGSTAFAAEMEGKGYAVIREIFHEERYESGTRRLNNDREDIRVSDLGTPGFKYRLDQDDLDRRDQACIDQIASRLEDINAKRNGLMVQVAESWPLTQRLQAAASAIGLDLDLLRLEYDPLNQACAILHNYLEGNAYFAGQALLVLLENDPRLAAVSPWPALMKALSCCGRTMAAIHLVRVMPRPVLLETIGAYVRLIHQTCVAAADAPTVKHDDPRRAEMYDRYHFLSAEVRRALYAEDTGRLRDWAGAIAPSRDFLSALSVPKNLMPIYRKGHKVAYGVHLDRIFGVNLDLAAPTTLVSLNHKDPSSVSGCLTERLKVTGVTLLGGLICDTPILRLDHLELRLSHTETPPEDAKIAAGNQTGLYFPLNISCDSAMYLEMHCHAFPKVILHAETRA